jgi:uncharacterized protein (DUF2141 family)
MIRTHKNGLLTKIRNFLLITILAAWQIAFAGAPLLQSSTAHAAPITDPSKCVNDTAGANDEPGQKDLTQLCIDDAGLPTYEHVTWNWDELGTSGSNTLDGCALFDTNGDGNINYSVCVTTTGNPATLQSTTLYSCGDDKIDRCTSPVTALTIAHGTSCSVSQQSTDPFSTGAGYPKDTVADCTLYLGDVGGGNVAKLIDVCSYPSQQPNSDPSDCVIIQPKSGKLEVKKHLVPASDGGLFNLQVNGVTKAANVGDGGTTGEIIEPSGNNGTAYTVGETAGTNSSLSNYLTSIECRNLNGTGSVVASGSTTSTSVTVNDGDDIVCVITNTASSSLTIVKDAIPNSSQDFAFTTSGTGLSGFSLDDDNDPTLPNSKTFSNLLPGQYSVTESATTGWDFDNISCSQESTVNVNGSTATITLGAGQNVTCTYTNRQRGHIVVHKVTQPANDPTGFSITASSSTGGNIVGNATQTITTANDVTYDVSQGTYAVSETVPSGWSQASNTCSNLVINGNTPLVNGVPTVTCTITNTKLAKLNIVKNTNPSSSSQTFVYGASGPSITNNDNAFTLDTNSADNTYPNNYQYVDLQPGSYAISETMPSNWTLTGLACSGTSDYSNPSGTNLSVNLAAGDDVTCTYTNTQYSSISGSKLEVNADSSVVQSLSGWTINLLLNGNVVATTSTDGSGMFSFNNLMSGDYSLVEVSPSGWTQIYAPGAISLTAGQTSTGNDFGNFHNASISGSKFNDVNGNGQWDIGEPGLQGWTVTLYDDGGTGALLNHQLNQTTTAADGSYSFTNLPPTNYKLCETPQTGWTQTYPAANDGCNLVTVALSGHEYSGNNFGNQGRGTITVVKNVDDGFGNVTSDVTTWTWGYNGTLGSASNIATGSSNSQTVAAGDYTVSENQKADYHVTSSSCSGETDASVATSKSVTVAPGENVVCTFTNTRDTGTITVVKNLLPANDPGKFNLLIDGVTKASDVGDKGTTGQVKVLTGSHSASETAGTSTSLSDYTSSYSCVDGRTTLVSGSGTASYDFSVAKDSNVVCTFTNTHLGQVTGSKFNDINGNHVWDQAEPGLQDWTINLYSCHTPQLSLNIAPVEVCDTLVNTTTTSQDGSYSFKDLQDGDYKVCEVQQTGWLQTYPQTADGCTNFTIDLSANPAQTVTANFGNQGRGTITVIKDLVPKSDSGKFNLLIDGQSYADNVGDGGTTGSIAVAAGSHDVSETAGSNTSLDDYTTTNVCHAQYRGGAGSGTSVNGINVAPGENWICTFTNTRQTGTITVTKVVNNNHGGKAAPADFPLYVNGIQVTSGITNTYNANQSYTVNESGGPAGYEQTSLVCSDDNGQLPSATFTLASAEHVSCVITNEDIAPILTVTKVVNNPFGTALDPSAFPLYVDGISVTSGVSTTQFGAGNHTVTESQQPGYEFTGVSGDCSYDKDTKIISLSMDIGGTYTCTLTNTAVQPKLIVKKHVINDNGGNKTAGDFTMTVTGNSASVSNFAGDENGTTVNLNEGDYAADEVSHDGYTETLGTDCTGTIKIGETKTCTITNNDIAPKLTLVKYVNGGTAKASDWSLSATPSDNQYQTVSGAGGFSEQTVRANLAYTLGETGPDGYSASSWDCNGGTLAGNQLTLPLAADVTCTITNTRDTGTITVYKELWPQNDTGLFNLNINGETSFTKANQGDGGTTGSQTVLTGDYTVSETAGTNTDLGNYDSYYYCYNNWEEYVADGSATSSTTFTVDKGESVTCYFQNIRHGKLTGQKFEDVNGNGKKDQGENGLKDWTIQLYKCQQQVYSLNIESISLNNDCAPVLAGTTITDANGNYTFDNLTSGDYKVCEVLQDGWTQTAPDNTGCQTFTIDLNIETGEPGQIVIKDFGNFHNGSISGFKFSDPNGNGKFDQGEVKLSGWTISLNISDGNGGWKKVGSAVTDSSGSYSFTDLAPGSYQVCEVPQDGWIRIFPTGSDCQTVDINQSGQNATALFANQKKVIPQVLGAELVNTGQAALLSIIAGTLALSVITGITLAARQNKR